MTRATGGSRPWHAARAVTVAVALAGCGQGEQKVQRGRWRRLPSGRRRPRSEQYVKVEEFVAELAEISAQECAGSRGEGRTLVIELGEEPSLPCGVGAAVTVGLFGFDEAAVDRAQSSGGVERSELAELRGEGNTVTVNVTASFEEISAAYAKAPAAEGGQRWDGYRTKPPFVCDNRPR